MQQKTILYLFGAVILFGVLHFFLLSPPLDFPTGATINIEKGFSLEKVSSTLKASRIIRSRVAFEFFVITLGGEKRIKPAFFNFEKPLPVFSVAWMVSGSKFYMAPVSVTIPEGFNREQIADTFTQKLPNFKSEQFLLQTAGQEGYLFPDTYFFLNTDSEKEAIKSLTENYEKKIKPLRPKISATGRTEAQIITMASIIEGEAKGDEDRALISGILWKRLKIGMALQADVAPITYKQRGLPENPIGNPGLKAIEAAIYPEASSYLYYLHDQDGNIHYAKNFTEHTANKRKYLNN